MKAQPWANLLMPRDARPFQYSESHLASNCVSFWCRPAQAAHFGTKSQSLHEQRERWIIYMGGQRHMPTHPLKAWFFCEWCMPTASTGVSTSSGDDPSWWSRSMTTWYRINRMPVEICPAWTTSKSGCNISPKVRAQNPDCKVGHDYEPQC